MCFLVRSESWKFVRWTFLLRNVMIFGFESPIYMGVFLQNLLMLFSSLTNVARLAKGIGGANCGSYHRYLILGCFAGSFYTAASPWLRDLSRWGWVSHSFVLFVLMPLILLSIVSFCANYSSSFGSLWTKNFILICLLLHGVWVNGSLKGLIWRVNWDSRSLPKGRCWFYITQCEC